MILSFVTCVPAVPVVPALLLPEAPVLPEPQAAARASVATETVTRCAAFIAAPSYFDLKNSLG